LVTQYRKRFSEMLQGASSMNFKEHTKKVQREYEDHMLKYGVDSPEAAHWIGRDKTWLRFKILTDVDDLNNKRVLDFGCGNALLLDFLKENKVVCEYHGWDVSKKIIGVAKTRHPEASFRAVHIFEDDLHKFQSFFDYIFISGVFYIKKDSESETHTSWLQGIMLKLWTLCKLGVAVNFMTEYVEWKDKDLYYCPIAKLAEFCVRNLSRWFVIRHEYPLWEFTIYIYKQPRERL